MAASDVGLPSLRPGAIPARPLLTRILIVVVALGAVLWGVSSIRLWPPPAAGIAASCPLSTTRRAGPPRAGDSDLVTSGEKTEARKSPAPPPSETSRSPRGRLPSMTDVTRILSAIEQGDPHAAEQLLPLVYDELRKLAAVRLALEKPWR